MFVKVCGITRLDDALLAAELGASAIGFVFWPGSPRFVDPYRARKIAAALPPFVTPIGVFVNQPRGYVEGVASLVRLGAVQLHGEESEAYCASLTRPAIKAVAVHAAAMTEAAPAVFWPKYLTLLLDVHDPERRGGTGRTIDWSVARGLARERRVLLAGGLRADNVLDAIATVRPFGIDVSSGVEARPGIKDATRLQEFFGVVRRGAEAAG